MLNSTSKIIAVSTMLFVFPLVSRAQTPCLVADYRLDGNAADSSGNGLHGTLNGTTSTSNRFGKPNSALYFNGASDFVRLGTDADFKERTISMWFKVESFPVSGGYSMVFATDFPTIKYGFTGVSVNNTGGAYTINSTVGANGKVNANAQSNKWYNYIIWVDANWVKYYLNGNLVDSFANNNFNHSVDGDTKARVGTSRKSVGFFNGIIDDVKIYDCAVNAADLKSLFGSSSIQKLDKPEVNVNIYPNPVQSTFNIESTSQNQIESIYVYDLQGKLLLDKSINDFKTVVDLTAFAKGMYILEVNTINGRVTSRISKE
jgi:hypothetical protein